MKRQCQERHEIRMDDPTEGRELEAESGILSQQSPETTSRELTQYTKAVEAQSVNRPTQSLSWKRCQDECALPQGARAAQEN